MTDAKKIADVAHPGQTPPSPNSKSVIITHRPTVKDPMVKPKTQITPPTNDSNSNDTDAQASNKTVSEQPLTRTHQTVLQPLPSSESETPAPAPTPTPITIPAPDIQDAKPIPPDVKAPPTQETPVATPTGTDAAIGTKEIQTDAQIAMAQDAEAKRLDDLRQMVETKQFYLPIETTENRRSKRVVGSGILLSLLLAAVWLDVALDAGLIHIGNLKAITHLFSQ